MSIEPDLSSAAAALERSRTAVLGLAADCCEPHRTPHLEALAQLLGEASRQLTGLTATTDPLPVIARLEDAGAAAGRLQVGCCAPGRIPLYAEVLEGLMTAQRVITRELRLEHGGTLG